MRLLIIVALIAFGAWWGFGKVKDAATFKDAKKQIAEVANPEKKASMDPFTPSVKDGLASPKSADTKKVSRVVSFKYRNPPTTEFLTSLSAFDVELAYDPSSRSVLLRGEAENVLDVADLLASGDLIPDFCSARAWVIFISDNDASGYDLTAALSSLTSTPLSGSLDSNGLIFNVPLGDLSAALNILTTDSRVELVQQPHLRLMDSVLSKVESLEEVPIRSTTVSNGLATASIEYKRVGLSMEITPHFLASERVRLAVKQTGGLVGRSVEIDGAEVPVLQTQNVETSVELTVGQSAVLGGVRSSRVRKIKGVFRDTTEIESGTLFVCLSLYEDTPRAIAVSPEWFSEVDEMLLPAKGVLPITVK